MSRLGGAVLAGAVVLAVGSAGCATIVKGTGQPVTITTLPQGATVYVDNQPVGTSPLTLKLKHSDHSLSAMLPGYQPGYAQLTTGFSGWALFFFPVGTIIDAVTGAITTLDQESVVITLGQGQGGTAPGAVSGSVPPLHPAGQP